MDWDNIKDIDQATMNSFTLSNLVQCVDDPRVYNLTPNGDMGAKSHLNITAAEFEVSYDWDAVYMINAVDRDAYAL